MSFNPSDMDFSAFFDMPLADSMQYPQHGNVSAGPASMSMDGFYPTSANVDYSAGFEQFASNLNSGEVPPHVPVTQNTQQSMDVDQTSTPWGMMVQGFQPPADNAAAAIAPQVPQAAPHIKTEERFGTPTQLLTKQHVVDYSSRVTAHHTEKLQSVLRPGMTSRATVPPGYTGPASSFLMPTPVTVAGQRSNGGSVSSAAVPMSQSVPRAITPIRPGLTLQERRRNSRRQAQTQGKSIDAARRMSSVHHSSSSSGTPAAAHPLSQSHDSSIHQTSGRNAKRGMNTASGHIQSPQATVAGRMSVVSESQWKPQKPQPLPTPAAATSPTAAPGDATGFNGGVNGSRQAYSSSGFDLLGALARVVLRPNPKIALGAVDLSCSFTVCDARHPEQPIVYCSDTFCNLTGYARDEVLGRSCRFLQAPGGHVVAGSERRHTDNAAVAHLKQHSVAMQECQASLINYRRDGTPFINLVTVVPIGWGNDPEPVYLVGFQVDLVEQPSAVLQRAEDGSYIVNYSHEAGNSFQLPSNFAEVYPQAIPRDLEQEAAKRKVVIGKELSNMISSGSDDSSQWARILLQHSQDFIHVLSLKGTFLYVSPSVERLYGYKPEQLIGKPVSDFCHPSDVVPVFRELKDSTSNASINAAAKRSYRSEGTSNRATKGGVGQGGPEVNLLFRMRHSNGSYSWLENKGKLHLEQGKGRKVVISSGRSRPVYELPWEPVKATVNDRAPAFWAKVSNDGLILSATEGVASVIDGVDCASLYGHHLTSMVNAEAMPALLGALRGVDIASVCHQMFDATDKAVWVNSTFYPSAVVPGEHIVPTVFIRVALNVEGLDNPYCRPNVSCKQSPTPKTPADTNVFGELDTDRSSSHIYELHSLKHVNRRLKEEVRSAQRKVAQKKKIAGPGLEQPAGLDHPTAPLQENFVKELARDNEKANRLAPPVPPTMATRASSSEASSSPGIATGPGGSNSAEQEGNTGSDDTAPTTATGSSAEGTDSPSDESEGATHRRKAKA